MARRLVLCSMFVFAVSVPPVWLGRTTVEAGPRTPAPAGACPTELGRAKQELATAREALKRSEAAEAAARAELERMKLAETNRLKRLEAQTGIAADKLR